MWRRGDSAHPVAREAARLEDAAVAGDAHRLVARERRGPRRAVRAHRERRGRVGVGLPEVRPDDRDRQEARRRAARAGVDDVAALLVLAGGGDGQVLDRDDRGKALERLGVPDADPPPAIRAGAAAGDDVTAGVDAEALGTRGGEPLRGARDRPALDEARGVEATGRADGEGAARRTVQAHAPRQHLVHLRPAVGQGQLAAVETADLAVLAVGAEGRVGLAEPVERHLDVDVVPDVDPDRDAHDVADLRHALERRRPPSELPGSELGVRRSGSSQPPRSELRPPFPNLAVMTGLDTSERLWRDPPARIRTRAAPVPPRRRPARRRPVVVDVLAAAAGIGLGITIGLEVTAESAGSLSAPGGIAIALGRLAGLLAAYAMVIVVLLVARVPPLERAIGQDRLVTWHRKLGPWPLYLLLGHTVLITVGYARQASTGVLHQFGQLLWTYPGILAATVGSLFLFAAAITSYRLARRRLAYETWWSVHLYTYLALFLSFSHQIDTGASFVGHPVARAWWTALWLGPLAVVLAARIGLPVWRSLRHRVRVVGARQEGPGVVSILLRGRRLDRLPVAGGQFFQWRFLRRGVWWQAHPYSLSAAPNGDLLRITVKDLGDHSSGLARALVGTRVAIEGPYGTFTADTATRDRVVLIGAGVGAAPILALLQDLPDTTDVIAVLRASTRADLVLRDAIAREAGRRGGRLVELVGPRGRVRMDTASLRGLVPDLPGRDVYVCGAEALSRRLAGELTRAGVPE